MSRIGFLIDRWDPQRGGAERALATLAQALEAAGHEVLALAARHAPDAPGRAVHVPWPRPPRAWTRTGRERLFARALVAAAEGCDVTIGIRHLPRVDLYWPHAGSHAASLAARREARGLDAMARPRGRHALFQALESRLLAGGARRVVCVSEGVRRELVSLVPDVAARSLVVPNGVDLARFRPADEAERTRWRATLELPVAQPVLVFAAREPRVKGIESLALALARLAERTWTLVLVGPRRPERWVRALERLGVPRARLRTPHEPDMASLLGAADLLVHPTFRDPAPLVVLEALACGTPVVTTSRAGNAELLSDAHVGTVLDDPRDVEGLARSVGVWLERIAAGTVDRARVRAAVGGREQVVWLARMVALVVELAGENQSERRRPGRSSSPGSSTF